MPVPQQSQNQTKLIVNVVVSVFLIIGLLLVLQYFNFIYLRDVPAIGGWLMDIYERVFGPPHVLIVHGDDSIGDYTALRKVLEEKLVFYSEDIDVADYSSGFGERLKRYGLVIVEDVQTLDKDKLVNFDDYIKGGGNVVWVADAGTKGNVRYKERIITNQSGWFRELVCVDEISMLSCDCSTVKANSTCKFLPQSEDNGVGQLQEDFASILGANFVKNVFGANPTVKIIDNDHWAITGIKTYFNMSNVNKIASVSTVFSTALLANIIIANETYPGVIVNDAPGSSGAVVYFAYPPEETPEILLPLIERLRY
jgi:hypothetical protein